MLLKKDETNPNKAKIDFQDMESLFCQQSAPAQRCVLTRFHPVTTDSVSNKCLVYSEKCGKNMLGYYLNSDLLLILTLSIRNVIKSYWKRPTTTIALQKIFAGRCCANSIFMLKKKSTWERFVIEYIIFAMARRTLKFSFKI